MQNVIHIAVVDDLPADREKTRLFLQEYAAAHGYTWQVTTFANGESLLAELAPGQFDLVFLDVVMEGIDGIETARRLRQIDSEILVTFLTTEASYAMEGYEVEAAGFLVKSEAEARERFGRLMQRLERRLNASPVLELQDKGMPVRLPVRGVVYAEVINHDLKLHTRERAYTLRMTMEEFRNQLPRDNHFFECYRGVIINLDHVQQIGTQSVRMDNGDTPPISRRRRSEAQRLFAERSIEKLRRGV